MAHTSGSFDTNVLLDWLLERDQSRCVAIDKLLQTGRVYAVSDLIIAETVFVMEKSYLLTRPAIHDGIKSVLDHPSLQTNQTVLVTQALETYVQRPALSFVDCYLLATAKHKNQAPIHTSDKKLATQFPDLAQLIT